MKGSHTFIDRSVMVESNGVAEDMGTKAEEVKSSDGEDPKTLGGIEGADQLFGYIIHFATQLSCIKRKTEIIYVTFL